MSAARTDIRGDTKAPPSTRLARRLASSGARTVQDPTLAVYMDKLDPLQPFRNKFKVPTKQTVYPTAPAMPTDGDKMPAVYLAGNSLGLMPIATPDLIKQELEVWSTSGVLGHMDHAYNRPWIRIDEHVTPILAEIVGALPSEVACMGSLTANLHALFTSFYKPTPRRHKILFEGKAFPSDQYAFASQVALHDYPPSSLLRVDPREGEYAIRSEDILEIIEREGDSIAIICFGAVQYYNGAWFDMEAITKAGHAKGCLVAFDCAHAVGNVPMKLHDWGVDFACWCSYKYLNSGPGGIAGLYVHERHSDQKRLAGWWGHDVSSRFAMSPDFNPMPGAAGWQMSNPSVLDVVSLLSSLEIFKQAGQVVPYSLSGGNIAPKPPILAALREKSEDLTAYLEALLMSSKHFLPVDRLSTAAAAAAAASAAPSTDVHFTIITPSDPSRRGAQLSLLFQPVGAMDPIFEALRQGGVLGDERRPGVIRLAPVPMYNSFQDCLDAFEVLEKALETYSKEQGSRD